MKVKIIWLIFEQHQIHRAHFCIAVKVLQLTVNVQILPKKDAENNLLELIHSMG